MKSNITIKKVTIRYLLKYFVQLNDLWMRTQPSECLYLSEVIDLFNSIEMVLHAFDSDIFTSLDALGFQNF